jgi:hypothetical protein
MHNHQEVRVASSLNNTCQPIVLRKVKRDTQPLLFNNNTSALNLDLQNVSTIQRYDNVGSGRNSTTSKTPLNILSSRSKTTAGIMIQGQQQFRNDKIRNFISKNIQESMSPMSMGSSSKQHYPKIKSLYNENFGVVQQQLINFDQ